MSEDVPILNSTEVTDLKSAYDALSYLEEDYNDGVVSWAENDTVLVVVSRGQRFQHHEFFRDHPHLAIQNPAGVVNDDTEQPHLKLELVEADK